MQHLCVVKSHTAKLVSTLFANSNNTQSLLWIEAIYTVIHFWRFLFNGALNMKLFTWSYFSFMLVVARLHISLVGQEWKRK